MRARETQLLRPLLGYLEGRNDLRLLGPVEPERRAPTVAVYSERPGEELAAALAPHGINAGGGDFYAVRPLRAMGIDPAHGVLRMSFTHYTTEHEIEGLIRALDHVL
jgi:selenocysteine lyase/cysteine desulfurase